jgi:hypothetical protein
LNSEKEPQIELMVLIFEERAFAVDVHRCLGDDGRAPKPYGFANALLQSRMSPPPITNNESPIPLSSLNTPDSLDPKLLNLPPSSIARVLVLNTSKLHAV